MHGPSSVTSAQSTTHSSPVSPLESHAYISTRMHASPNLLHDTLGCSDHAASPTYTALQYVNTKSRLSVGSYGIITKSMNKRHVSAEAICRKIYNGQRECLYMYICIYIDSVNRFYGAFGD